MINFRQIDDRMRADNRRDKINLAKKLGFKYYSQMVHEKKKEGIGSRLIAKFINDNTIDFEVSVGSVDHLLRVMGFYKYIKVQRKNAQAEDLGMKHLPVDKSYINKLCSCCGEKTGKHVAPGQRCLCKTCYTNNSGSTERHGIVNFTG